MPLMAALGPDDKIATHHRNHGHVLARGADPKLALAEILGRENGINRGAGGTMHMSDTDRGFISTSAIVGGSISLATGAGFALKSQGGDAIAVGLFGDGALEEGVSYESLNLAALWDAAGPLRLREQQRGRARLGRRRLPHLGLRGRRPDRHPAHVRDPGRDRRRPRPRGGLRRRVEGRRAHARAQGPVLRPRGDRALRGHASRSGRRCRPARPTSRWPGTTRGSRASTSSGTASTTRCCATRGELLAAGEHQPGRADRARRAGARADRRGAPVRARQPAAHARKRTRPRLRLRRRATMATKNYADAMLDVLTTFMEEDPQLRRDGQRGARDRPRGHAVRAFQEKYGDRIYFPPCSEAAYSALAAGAAMCGQRMLLHLGPRAVRLPGVLDDRQRGRDRAAGLGRQGHGPGDLPHEPRPAARRRGPAQREPDGDVLERRRASRSSSRGGRPTSRACCAPRSRATTRRS